MDMKKEALLEADSSELYDICMELAVSLCEVFEALKKISSGDPEVRIPEASEVEVISKLKHMVNMTAKNIGEMVDQTHEFAMVIAEHFDVLRSVSKGDLDARVSGESKMELLETFNVVTNEMIASIHQAITKREQTEKLLKESEKRYRHLSELEPQVFFEADKKGKLIFVNRRAFDIFDYASEDISKGLNIIEVLVPEDRERALQNLQRRFKGEKLGGVEYRALRKDGGTFPVLVFASPIIRNREVMGLRVFSST